MKNTVTKSGKAARSTCTECHMVYDRKDMCQIERTENSGHSHGGGVSMGRRRKLKNGGYTRDTRVSASHRRYYRKKKYWVCNNCLEESHQRYLAAMAALEASYGPVYKFFRAIWRKALKPLILWPLGIAFVWLIIAVPVFIVGAIAGAWSPAMETVAEVLLKSLTNVLDHGVYFSAYEGGLLENLGGLFGPFVLFITWHLIIRGGWKRI